MMATGLHDDGPMIGHIYDGYSDAVALRAVPSSAAHTLEPDIARGMGATPVNPQQATSAVGRELKSPMIGESAHHFIGYQQESAYVDKTSDGHRVKGHQGKIVSQSQLNHGLVNVRENRTGGN